MISAVAKRSEVSIQEIKFHIYLFKVTKFSKEWKIWPKTHFLVFALLVGNFSNKHHYNLLKILRIFCFWYFCLKWLFSKLFVLKVDLCIKVVALIKITTVEREVIKEQQMISCFFAITKWMVTWSFSLQPTKILGCWVYWKDWILAFWRKQVSVLYDVCEFSSRFPIVL